MRLSVPASILVSPFLLILGSCGRAPEAPVIYSPEPTVESLVEQVSAGDGTFTDVSFATLIETSTEHTILPLDPSQPIDAEILAAIRQALTETLTKFNRPDSVTNSESRINEASAHFEEGIRHVIEEQPGFSCDYPRNAEGNLQRAGYPDLRIVHQASGRVAYLDPKVVKTGSFDSSLRSFYFTPKVQTGKVLDDAHHLLVGIEHDGNTGRWKFLGWHLVDLTEFKVRLKAEFQASNRDLYRPELIVESQTLDPEKKSD